MNNIKYYPGLTRTIAPFELNKNRKLLKLELEYWSNKKQTLENKLFLGKKTKNTIKEYNKQIEIINTYHSYYSDMDKKTITKFRLSDQKLETAQAKEIAKLGAKGESLFSEKAIQYMNFLQNYPDIKGTIYFMNKTINETHILTSNHFTKNSKEENANIHYNEEENNKSIITLAHKFINLKLPNYNIFDTKFLFSKKSNKIEIVKLSYLKPLNELLKK